MSFKSILTGAFHFLVKSEPAIESAAKFILPQTAPVWAILDPIIARIPNAVVTAEATAPDGTLGSVKSEAVFADFESGLALTNTVLAADGKTLEYDHAALQSAINAQVEALKQMAAVKTSIHIVALAAGATQGAA